ncbi:serine hydrolase [Deinococcus humi]|uniref:Beta-lactamase class A n=1 Tax=Deinococcus humi TaxID=662880 RepID=A0A7W8K2Y3_9DEIO|nr:serine hydrolase [Deinococcus humi]MBB5366324.1 beta-lactamase class A [Deinococcus humi]GGO41232.1 serine hydrolase [Deinococcus humi]
MAEQQLRTPSPFLSDLRAQGYAGEVGLRVCDLAGQELFALNPERVFPAASTIKVPLLILALEWVQTGRLRLEDRVTLAASDRVPGAGVLHELGPGLALSWLDVLTLMIIVSDNTATNLVIEVLGVEAVNAWLDTHGFSQTRLIGKLQLPPAERNAAQRRGERNRTSALEQTDLLGRLVRGELLDAAHTALALDILERQQLRDLIGRGLPRAENGELLYRLASKSGELDGVHHDVGVLYTPRPLLIALLTEGGADRRELPGNRDVNLLSEALWPLLATLGQVFTNGDI